MEWWGAMKQRFSKWAESFESKQLLRKKAWMLSQHLLFMSLQFVPLSHHSGDGRTVDDGGGDHLTGQRQNKSGGRSSWEWSSSFDDYPLSLLRVSCRWAICYSGHREGRSRSSLPDQKRWIQDEERMMGKFILCPSFPEFPLIQFTCLRGYCFERRKKFHSILWIEEEDQTGRGAKWISLMALLLDDDDVRMIKWSECVGTSCWIMDEGIKGSPEPNPLFFFLLLSILSLWISLSHEHVSFLPFSISIRRRDIPYFDPATQAILLIFLLWSLFWCHFWSRIIFQKEWNKMTEEMELVLFFLLKSAPSSFQFDFPLFSHSLPSSLDMLIISGHEWSENCNNLNARKKNNSKKRLFDFKVQKVVRKS